MPILHRPRQCAGQGEPVDYTAATLGYSCPRMRWADYAGRIGLGSGAALAGVAGKYAMTAAVGYASITA